MTQAAFSFIGTEIVAVCVMLYLHPLSEVSFIFNSRLLLVRQRIPDETFPVQ